MERTFLVKLSAPEYDAHMMYTDAIQYRLTQSYTDDGYAVRVDSIERYDPESTKALGKISAIKRVRDLLASSLIQAKLLVDYAQKNGMANWDGLVITYVNEGEYDTDKFFTVADNR